MAEASPTKPPFHVTSWGESTSNNLNINVIEISVGRIFRQLTIDFELHSAEEHLALNQAIQEGHFLWLLPILQLHGNMQHIVYKGLIHECRIDQTGRSNTLEAKTAEICTGNLTAIVFESYPA